MKRESRDRSILATAVVVLILLGTPAFGRAKKERVGTRSSKTAIERLVVWVQTRIVPPWPEPVPDPPATTSDGATQTTTDVVTTST